MPLYEYECTECGRRTEKIQKFSDPELTVCPFCSAKLERTLTAPAVQFKGGGWYKDLYSSAKPSAATSGDAAAKPTDASSTSKPTESMAAPASSSGSSSPSGAPSPSAAPASPAKG